MRKYAPLILILWLLAAGLPPTSAMGQETREQAQEQEDRKDRDEAISRVKLKEDSLPDVFEITEEIRATQAQIYRIRQKIGFPLTALLNQKISYGAHQARINYMSLPSESWVGFGYSSLIKSDGRKGMVMVKDGVLIQMVASAKELEDLLILLLGIGPLQTHKIRYHRFPEGWELESERFFSRDELRELELTSGGTIREGLQQEIIVNRTEATITYFDCTTEESADLVGQELSASRNSIEKRVVKGYGSIIAVADSTNGDLNRQIFLHMNR